MRRLKVLSALLVLGFGAVVGPGAEALRAQSPAESSRSNADDSNASSAGPATKAGSATKITIARVQYGGGGDWYSDEHALPELLAFVRRHTLLDVAPQAATVKLSTDQVFTYPYLYLTGHGNVRFAPPEVKRLRRYLTGGGFLHIDDNYGLDKSIRRELEKVFPDKKLRLLPDDHPIYSAHFDFPGGLPKIHEHDGQAAQGFGLFSDAGRLMVFYSYESDLGDGWDPASVHDNSEATRRQALRMGTNVLVYAMTR
ncbi:MAG: hypothetical protein BRD48_05340 [Bacteroidetes bacterium QS_9_68_14]|nr:MAG: hypothetical protein BRD48_05340 [Bacteroidetes bacterium QS_9_68_14]